MNIVKMTDKELVKIIINDLGKSHVTAYNWIGNKTYPAESCIKIECLTDGAVPAQSLRPDVFEVTPAQQTMNDSLHNLIVEADKFDQQTSTMLTIILGYFKTQQPSIYESLIESLQASVAGREYLNHRKVYISEEL